MKKKEKKKIALNKLFNFCVIAGLFFGWIAFDSISENDIAFTLITGALSLLIIVLSAIFTPVCYLFDSRGVTLHYIFLPNERYLWDNVRAIEVDWQTSSARASFFDLIYNPSFRIEGKCEGKMRFYMEGRIRKSFRTKHLLEKYWDGEITGYFGESIRNRLKKRKQKKEKEISAHLTDEIVPLERETRKELSELLSSIRDRAAQYGIGIRADYLYITRSGEELRSRPDEGYSYTAEITFYEKGKNERENKLSFYLDLISVRLGKTAYRGIKEDGIFDHLKEEADWIIKDIAEKGFAEVMKEY